MEVSYLNCGLKRSLKCGILAVFERYVCSNEEDLKNSVLHERDSNPDLCYADAVLNQLSYQSQQHGS